MKELHSPIQTHTLSVWTDHESINSGMEIKIDNIPKVLWLHSPEQFPHIYEARLTSILAIYGIPEVTFTMTCPFNTARLERYIQVNNLEVVSFLGFADRLNIEVRKEVLKIRYHPNNSLTKIDKGVYFLCHTESEIENRLHKFELLFVSESVVWDKEAVINFLKSFSKKIYELGDIFKIEDKTVFDSIFLPDNVLGDIRRDFESFLESRDMYKKDLGLSWKRGYMLIGPPGNGKSLLIRKMCQYYGLDRTDIKDHIQRDGSLNLNFVMDASIEDQLFPPKPVICVLEDIDKFTSFQSGTEEQDSSTISLHALLKGLDGVDEYDGIILMATTNFPDTLHEAIVGRPGRFDKIYKIEVPTTENILRLLEYYKISVTGGGGIKEVADSLKGYSMAFVAEFVKMAKMRYKRNEITQDESAALLKEIHVHLDMCKNHFKEEKIKPGFNKL